MIRATVFALVVACATPTLAESIKGMELSPEDAGRVQRQCDALNAQAMRSLAADTPEPPMAGETVSDAAGYWADDATGMDASLSRINLGALTIRDCREAGFY